ncbi:MAG TPA: multicopper oxidase domain-containing protein [Gemmatimonadales bacterium]|nr:multicopper oxidase domain-containing protein [Gemmatimonadales bacterium]
MRVHLVSLLAAGAAAFTAPRSSTPPPVVPNDNRAPAGRLANDTLSLELVLQLATWRPEGPDGPSVDVAAFAESGGPAQIPAPLVRVTTGTVIRATVTNALDSAHVIRGLHTRPGTSPDTVVLAAGATRTFTFAAGEPGTYFYDALPAGYAPPAGTQARQAEREHAAGALVIDPPGGSPPDRILVINIRGDRIASSYRNALAINGLSWPHTERFDARTGDTVRWRVINASSRTHPMHLHGFYFTVAARGTLEADQPFAPEQRRLMVTETMDGYSTMAMSWVASRPGNWLFHCHLAFHVVPSARLGAGAHASADPRSHEAGEHMAGLVVGMRVRAGPGYADGVRAGVQRRRVFVQEGPRRGLSPKAMGYVLQRDVREPAADSIEIPGSVLVLERGIPADVTVINRLDEPAAIHWHGLELESWSDGVAGWSGLDTMVAPAIAAGDSFVARLTVPRAGTFIYHTHMNDIEQLTSGLYGAIVVLEPGDRLDPLRDHLAVMSWDGDAVRGRAQILINGDSVPKPIEVRAGEPHRLRFVNIGPAGVMRLELKRGSALAEWRRLALDGASLPPAQAIMSPAGHRLAVGQTADFEVRLAPGRYSLSYFHNPVTPVRTQAVVAR